MPMLLLMFSSLCKAVWNRGSFRLIFRFLLTVSLCGSAWIRHHARCRSEVRESAPSAALNRAAEVDRLSAVYISLCYAKTLTDSAKHKSALSIFRAQNTHPYRKKTRSAKSLRVQKSVFVAQHRVSAFYSVDRRGDYAAGVACALAAGVKSSDIRLEKLVADYPDGRRTS